jgi:molybdopterin-synthase adenylyltransferase
VDFDQGRYSRHKLLDWFDQDQIAAMRVLVVGAGAIGNEVLKNLALLGVRYLGICDLDTIEVHNLTRSVLFREGDVGKGKAAVAAAAVLDILPEAQVRAFAGDLTRLFVPSDFTEYNLVFSCLDNFEARLHLDELCFLAGVDVVSGAIDARFSSVEIYPYRSSPAAACYSCNLPTGAYHRIAQRYSCGWLRRIGLVEKKVPTTTITSSLAGAVMVSWGLRLGGAGTVDGSKRLLQDSFTGESTRSDLQKNASCPFCSGVRGKAELLPWNHSLEFPEGFTSRDVHARAPTELVFSAVCEACGHDARGEIQPGSRVRTYSTDARRCAKCGVEAVKIEAKDVATLGEFAALRSGDPPEIPYLLVEAGEKTICLEVQHERVDFIDHPNG